MCVRSRSKSQIQWPVGAASRIRIRFTDIDVGGQQFCRLFYNDSNNVIELVCSDDEIDSGSRRIYDDIDTGVEDEPTYRSYVLTMNNTDRSVVDFFHLDDVIGANLSLDCSFNNSNTFLGMERYSSNANINIYAYPKIRGGRIDKGGKRCANHKKYTIDSTGIEDFRDVRKIIDAIRNLASLQSPTNKKSIRYLVVLNPFSGGGGVTSKKGSKYTYETMLNPMLEQAGVEHDLLVTGGGGHAQERMSQRSSVDKKDTGYERRSNETLQFCENLCINMDTETSDISEYSGIIAMGGDGILFEIMQGIHDRADEKDILNVMKFGIVGCGTCNGLAKSILHWSEVSLLSISHFFAPIYLHTSLIMMKENYGQLESIFHICKGNTAPLDVATYQLAKSSKTYNSFLTFSWGLIADIDLDSECLRFLGSLRQDIWAVYRGILFPKKYRAKFSYLPFQHSNDTSVNETAVFPGIQEALSEEWLTIEDDFKVFWKQNATIHSPNILTQ